MEKRRFILILLLVLAVFVPILADNPNFLEIKPMKKVIHVDGLGMSDNTVVMDALQVMPELVSRGTDELLANYSIQIDGQDVGKSRDVVLMQTRLIEVDVIEVSPSPTASEQKNGQGGVINIKLRPVQQEGVSGAVLLDASTEWDVQPSVMVNYKKNNLTLRANVAMEYYRPTWEVNSKRAWLNEDAMTQMQYTRLQSYKQETAKLYLLYRPTERDELKVFVWESFGMNKEDATGNGKYITNVTDKLLHADGVSYYRTVDEEAESLSNSQDLTVVGCMKYKHLYAAGGELCANATYNYSPSKLDSWEEEYIYSALGSQYSKMDTTWSEPHELKLELTTKHPVIPKSTGHLLDVEVGVNATYSTGKAYEMHRTYRGIPERSEVYANTSGVYASPFMEWNYKYDIWMAQLGVRYQYLGYWDARNDDHYDNHSVTGNVSLDCKLAKHHDLRLLAARNIARKGAYVQPYYNVELNYVFDWADEQDRLTTGCGINYIHADLIVDQIKSNTLNANLMLFYGHDFFTMAFAANLYYKHLREQSTDLTKKGWYYNLSWTPVFSLPHQWTLSGRAMYNSKIMAWHAEYGDCVYAQVRLSKKIKNWEIHAEVDDVFGFTTTDHICYEDYALTEEYTPYKRAFLIGFEYKF